MDRYHSSRILLLTMNYYQLPVLVHKQKFISLADPYTILLQLTTRVLVYQYQIVLFHFVVGLVAYLQDCPLKAVFLNTNNTVLIFFIQFAIPRYFSTNVLK